MTQERWKVHREARHWTPEEFESRRRSYPEMIEYLNGIFAQDNQRFTLLETIGVDTVVKFGNLEDWKAAIAKLERQWGSDSQ
jgi:3-deoxy-D-manno-octulosonic-acid transferase